MPEIGEVARIVHFIKQNLAGKTLAKVTAQADENVYGKVGCSADDFVGSLQGKKVVDARQQGKYFWMIMSSPPHPLMHFGMAGWFHIRNMETQYYKPNASKNSADWPPKYWKFALSTAEGPDKCEAAFVDFRRFARIRLIHCPADEIRTLSPLKENGPDPVQDKDVLTEEWLSQKLGSKHVPVKALLLDQANISGIGNWVGDEILYNAKIHPEQYSNTLTAAQIKQLHNSIRYVCDFAVDNLADSNKFPEEWLFKHRWGKGKKDRASTLPNGSKFVFLTVGGRTSCVVPSVQKKTGPVAGDIKGGEKEEEEEAEEDDVGDQSPDVKPKKKPVGKKPAAKSIPAKAANEEKDRPPVSAKAPNKKRTPTAKEEEKDVAEDQTDAESESKPASKKRKSTSTTAKSNGVQKKAKREEPPDGGRRRSTRVGGSAR